MAAYWIICVSPEGAGKAGTSFTFLTIVSFVQSPDRVWRQRHSFVDGQARGLVTEKPVTQKSECLIIN